MQKKKKQYKIIFDEQKKIKKVKKSGKYFLKTTSASRSDFASGDMP